MDFEENEYFLNNSTFIKEEFIDDSLDVHIVDSVSNVTNFVDSSDFEALELSNSGTTSFF